MSIQRNRFGHDGEITFECDGCGEELHTETADFQSAVKIKKQQGWGSKKDSDGDWFDVCPKCF